jgi:N-carbamoyl-L-amino-acid hydrolase
LAKDFATLSTFTEPDHPGWTRRVFSEADRRAREWIGQAFADAGLRVAVDAGGNVIGDLPRTDNRPMLVTGSHTDTVAGGGRFDGIVGVLAALELVRALRDARLELRSPLRVVDFLGEEPNRYGLSCVGSRAVSGALTKQDLDLTDQDGSRLGDAIRSVNGDLDPLSATWDPSEVACFVELHIEQGPELWRNEIPLGVVTAIAGIHRARLTFTGQPDHAGTTPMNARRDALCAAAEMTLAVERIADGGAVGTTGRIKIEPDATNVVPGQATIWTEFRSPDEAWLAALQGRVATAANEIARRRRTDVAIEWLSAVAPVPTHELVRSATHRAIDRMGVGAVELYSGAGHDAAHVARLAPMGMLFVPSVNGRSHCPEEETPLSAIATGVVALGETLLELDRQLA